MGRNSWLGWNSQSGCPWSPGMSRLEHPGVVQEEQLFLWNLSGQSMGFRTGAFPIFDPTGIQPLPTLANRSSWPRNFGSFHLELHGSAATSHRCPASLLPSWKSFGFPGAVEGSLPRLDVSPSRATPPPRIPWLRRIPNSFVPPGQRIPSSHRCSWERIFGKRATGGMGNV